MIVLVTGPVRAGKSTRAAQIAHELGLPVTFVVTARLDPDDREMTDRIVRHRRERGGQATIELWLPGVAALPALVGAAAPQTTIIIDSLGTWLAGHLLDFEDLAECDGPAALARLGAIGEPLVESLRAARANVVLVAEETGWGVVPVAAQGRIFRDALGLLTRRIGQCANRVELVVAGFALDIRSCGVPVGEATSDAAAATG